MFNNILFYLVIGLSASTMGFGYLSYHLNGVNAELELGLVQAIDVNTSLQKSLNLRDISCKIDEQSVVELAEEKNKIDESISPINNQLKQLATPRKSNTPVLTDVLNTKQETTKDESNFLPDDGLLSPSVTRLLNDGWCSVYPDSDQCIPSR